MTNEQIREAIFNLVDDNKEHYNNDIQTLITLARSVLNVGEMKEIVVPQREWEDMNEAQRNYVKGRNQALHDFRLWLANKLMGLEEVIRESSLCHLCLSNVDEGEKEMKELSKAIKELLGGET